MRLDVLPACSSSVTGFDRLTKTPRALLVAAALAAILVPVCAEAAAVQSEQADAQQEAAVTAAQVFVTRFDDGDFGEIYDEELSQTFKSLVARETFVQQGGFVRVQSGGRALAREFVGAQAFSQTPTGASGQYYYVRFRTRYPNALVFQDVYLENVDGRWKVMGFYLPPAPQQ